LWNVPCIENNALQAYGMGIIVSNVPCENFHLYQQLSSGYIST